MGWCLNPSEGTKEAWLAQHASQLERPVRLMDELPEGQLAVCLVDNGPFTAAGVCHDQRELDEFNEDDGRPRTWWVAPADLLRAELPGAGA